MDLFSFFVEVAESEEGSRQEAVTREIQRWTDGGSLVYRVTTSTLTNKAAAVTICWVNPSKFSVTGVCYLYSLAVSRAIINRRSGAGRVLLVRTMGQKHCADCGRLYSVKLSKLPNVCHLVTTLSFQV